MSESHDPVRVAAAVLASAAEAFRELADFAQAKADTYDSLDGAPGYVEAVARKAQAEQHRDECQEHARLLLKFGVEADAAR